MGHTEKELRQLALDYVAGHIITDQNVPKDIVTFVFMPLGMTDDIKAWRDVRMIYGDRRNHRTCGIAVNGFPIFFECGTLNQGELDRFVTFVDEARAYIKAFRGE